MSTTTAHEITVSWQDIPFVPETESLIRRAVQAALGRHLSSTACVNVVLVNDEIIGRLHQEFLGSPGPTDVLSFDLSDEAPPPAAMAAPTSPAAHLIEGEVVVSAETAAREAAHRGIDVSAEIALYALHGTLHLLGFDDADDIRASRMHAEEAAILSSLGLGDVFQARPRRDAKQ